MIIPTCKIHTVEEEAFGGGPKGGVERRIRRRRVSLTQYLESQEDQDMTRLFNFTKTQEKRREGVFMCSRMEERGGLYSSGGENINRVSFNEVDKGSKKIMNLDLILGCV